MALDLSPPELGKFISAYKALDFIESGMKLGLGTGSTAAWLVKLLAYEINNNGLVISACATSSETTKLGPGSILFVHSHCITGHPIIDYMWRCYISTLFFS